MKIEKSIKINGGKSVEFIYFSIGTDNGIKMSLKNISSNRLSKRSFEKRFVLPLTTNGLSVFHLHKFAPNFYHLVLLMNNKHYNCFYDKNQKMFLFEKNVALVEKIAKTSLGIELTLLSPGNGNYHFWTQKELIDMLENR